MVLINSRCVFCFSREGSGQGGGELAECSKKYSTPWSIVLLEKLTGLQIVKKFPAFHGTRRFITALTSVRHLSLSWASPIQSMYPHPTSWRSILRLGLSSGLFPSRFPTKILYTPLSSPIRATCPAHLGVVLKFCYTVIRHLKMGEISNYPEKNPLKTSSRPDGEETFPLL